MNKHIAITAAAAVLAAGGAGAALAPAAEAGSGSVVPVGRHTAAARTLQQELHTLGYFRQTPTGYYGAITRAAVAGFQKAHALRATGLDDKTTDAAIRAAFAKHANPAPAPLARVTGHIVKEAPVAGGWRLTVSTVHVCTAGDKTAACAGVKLSPSQEYQVVPTGTRTLTAAAGTRLVVLKPGSSNAFRTTTLGSAMRSKTRINPAAYFTISSDRGGRVTSIQQLWMQ